MPINYLDQAQQKIYNQKAINLNNWSRRVSDMKGFVIPEKYEMGKVSNKYDRFTGFIQHWVEELLATDLEDGEGVLESNDTIYNLGIGRTDLMIDWWEVAKQVGRGKQINNTLPKFHEVTEESKQHVYNAFLPAYRAIKESFEKRSAFEWFYNHRQYTAERDSLRALEGIMATLTGDSKDKINARLDEYVAEIPSSNLAVATKALNERIQKQRNEAVKPEIVEPVLIEMERKPQVSESIDEPTMDDTITESIDASDIGVKADNGVRFAMTLTSEGFEERIINEIKNAIPKDCTLSTKAQEVFSKNIAFENIIERAVNDFNADMDEAIEAMGDVDPLSLSTAVKDGVQKVFAEAFECTSFLRLPLKDRLIVAQRFSDIALNAISPVAFQKGAFGDYGEGYVLLNTDRDTVKDIVKDNMTDKASYTDEEIESAYEQAHTEYDLEMKRTPISIEELQESASIDVAEKQEGAKQIDSVVNAK